MAKTDGIDPSTPAGSRSPTLGDDDIRKLARAVIELINVDHVVGSDSGQGLGYVDDVAGEHVKVTLNAPLADHPANVANKGHIYSKDVASADSTNRIELFFQDEEGKYIQLSQYLSGLSIQSLLLDSGYLSNATFLKGVNEAGDAAVNLLKAGRNEADDADVIVISDAARLVTNAAPGEDTGVANKKYVDDNKTGFAGYVSGSLMGITWPLTKNDHVTGTDIASTEATVDGFLICRMYATSNGSGKVDLYTDSADPPTIIRATNNAYWSNDGQHYGHSIMIPIKSGEYFKAEYTDNSASNVTRIYNWMSLS